jgi:hypothetical protein
MNKHFNWEERLRNSLRQYCKKKKKNVMHCVKLYFLETVKRPFVPNTSLAAHGDVSSSSRMDILPSYYLHRRVKRPV